MSGCLSCFFFFFNDTATTEIYTLSLHDALPIFYLDGLLDTDEHRRLEADRTRAELDHQHARREVDRLHLIVDRKSTRLNSSHANISYAVFCLKKKKNMYDELYITYAKDTRSTTP